MNLPPNEILGNGLERILASLDEVTDNPQLRIFILVNSLVCDAIESRRDEISWDDVKRILAGTYTTNTPINIEGGPVKPRRG